MHTESEQVVSVIIAAYNCEHYVSQTLQSVCGQTYQHLEIIVINDGSTDHTLSILEQYAQKDPRIKIITQQNSGVSAARNAGFKIARGQYFCLFDADDIMLPTKIESQVYFLRHNPGVDFTYSSALYFIDGQTTIYKHDLTIANGKTVYKKLLRHGNFIYTGTVMFHRNVFDTFGGFDEQLRSAEEFDYWLSLSWNGVNFLHQDMCLTLCRSRGNGLTADSVTMYATAILVLEKHLNNSKKNSFAKIGNYQYLKSKLLLYISRLRKNPQGQNNHDTMQGGNKSFNVRNLVNKVYGLLKKIRFSMTFTKVHNKTIEQYLVMIEQSRNV